MRKELCTFCGNETGRAGRADDSIFIGHSRVDHGPACEECRDDILLWAREYEERPTTFVRFRVQPHSVVFKAKALYFRDLDKAIKRAQHLMDQDGLAYPWWATVEGNRKEYKGEWELLATYKKSPESNESLAS